MVLRELRLSAVKLGKEVNNSRPQDLYLVLVDSEASQAVSIGQWDNLELLMKILGC